MLNRNLSNSLLLTFLSGKYTSWQWIASHIFFKLNYCPVQMFTVFKYEIRQITRKKKDGSLGKFCSSAQSISCFLCTKVLKYTWLYWQKACNNDNAEKIETSSVNLSICLGISHKRYVLDKVPIQVVFQVETHSN